MADVEVTHSPNPWKDFQDPIFSSEELDKNFSKIAGMDGVSPEPLAGRNISADEMTERAEKASRHGESLTREDKAMMEELHYRATGQYQRKYF